MIQLAFYKAKTGNFFDYLIGWWTRPNTWNIFSMGKYSHVEIVFFERECFSSSPRDGGTRWKVIDGIYTSGNWDIVDISNDPGRIKCILSQCERQEHKKYDWFCIFLSNLLAYDIHDRNRWTCAELVAAIVFVCKRPHQYTPNDLAKICKLDIKG